MRENWRVTGNGEQEREGGGRGDMKQSAISGIGIGAAIVKTVAAVHGKPAINWPKEYMNTFLNSE